MYLNFHKLNIFKKGEEEKRGVYYNFCFIWQTQISFVNTNFLQILRESLIVSSFKHISVLYSMYTSGVIQYIVKSQSLKSYEKIIIYNYFQNKIKKL